MLTDGKIKAYFRPMRKSEFYKTVDKYLDLIESIEEFSNHVFHGQLKAIIYANQQKR
jgi:hypothetical protein